MRWLVYRNEGTGVGRAGELLGVVDAMNASDALDAVLAQPWAAGLVPPLAAGDFWVAQQPPRRWWRSSSSRAQR